MSKLSQLERVLAKVDAEIAQLENVKQRLLDVRDAAPAPKRKRATKAVVTAPAHSPSGMSRVS